jgi:hypothetical protein
MDTNVISADVADFLGDVVWSFGTTNPEFVYVQAPANDQGGGICSAYRGIISHGCRRNPRSVVVVFWFALRHLCNNRIPKKVVSLAKEYAKDMFVPFPYNTTTPDEWFDCCLYMVCLFYSKGKKSQLSGAMRLLGYEDETSRESRLDYLAIIISEHYEEDEYSAVAPTDAEWAPMRDMAREYMRLSGAPHP